MSQPSSRPWRSPADGAPGAAIEIGSDTIHLLIADLAGRPREAVSPTRTVHSESDLAELGLIRAAAAQPDRRWLDPA